ncbi:MAG TPA: DUF1684 domain-containing protein [Ignavibacteria bacterium]|nr:DUF1684 domain-containing protein [Ignavibacteria bacterium]
MYNRKYLWVTILSIFTLSFLMLSCGKSYTPKQKKYIASIKKWREQKDDYMKNNLSSPFNQDPNANFSPLKYYKVNLNFVFKSKLFKYSKMDTVQTFGTKGEIRKILRFGYLKFDYKGKNYKANIYKGGLKSGRMYYIIWFTDKTTGNETYGVGRYLDFELNPDSSHIYTLDFNLAYNPYCSYSAKYSCAIPTKEDHLDLAIKAGEKKFH